MRRTVLLVGLLALLGLPASIRSATAAAASCSAPAPLTFAAPTYVDTGRAGGEPMIQTHPDGTLLYSAHAGTTHFFAPAIGGEKSSAFWGSYEGQTYFWYSTDHGDRWTFVPRIVPNNLPMSGFSDPDFAVDAAGDIYLSEINLVNVAMSKSADRGKSWTLQNFFAQTITDRQWSEADEEGVVYLVGNSFGGGTVPTQPVGNDGHYLYKSRDGGATFTAGVQDGAFIGGTGLGDLRIDRRDGTLYETWYDPDSGTGELAMQAFRKARRDDLTPERHPIAMGVGLRSHWPSFDVDDAGNLYAVWDETGDGPADRASGIWYAYSTDRGVTWSKPLRIDAGPATDIWPWIAVGDPGRVAVAWLQSDVTLPDDDAESPGEHGWRLVVAQTVNGLGCQASAVPGFTISRATPPIHTGTVCMGGTLCQLQAIDRRLGDYFSIDIDATGRFVAAFSDTRQGGVVSLPGFVRQASGPSFFGPTGAVLDPSKPPADVLGSRRNRGRLAATGLDPAATAATGAAFLVCAAAVLRRLRTR